MKNNLRNRTDTRMTDEMLAAMLKTAAEREMSFSKLVRHIVGKWIKKHGGPVNHAIK